MSRANVARWWRTTPDHLSELPRREYLRMERYAAEALKAERDAAVKRAIKANMPIFEIAAEYGLSEAEIGKLIVDQSGPRRTDDIMDARSDPRLVKGRG